MNELEQVTIVELKQIFDGLTKAANFSLSEILPNAGDGDNLKAQFVNAEKRLEEIIGTVNKESALYFKLLTMKSSLLYEEAKIRLNKDDVDGAQELLERTFSAVYDHRNHSQVAFLYLRVVNHLSYLLSKKGELPKAQHLLEEVTTSKAKVTDVIVYR